jgi:dimethylglycine dehydrogenase
MSHQYLVTAAIDELKGRAGKLPLLRDPQDSYYLRQEGDGLLLGPYEWKATPHWSDGVPERFAFELFPDDLERLERHIELACRRVPILGSVGIKKVINCPIPYTPDGNPLLGPAPGLTNSTRPAYSRSASCRPAAPARRSPTGWWTASPSGTCGRSIRAASPAM